MLAKLIAASCGVMAVVGPSGGGIAPGGDSSLPRYGDDPLAIVSICYNNTTCRVRVWRLPEMLARGAKIGACK